MKFSNYETQATQYKLVGLSRYVLCWTEIGPNKKVPLDFQHGVSVNGITRIKLGKLNYIIKVCAPECHLLGTGFSKKNPRNISSRTFGNIFFSIPTQYWHSGLASSHLLFLSSLQSQMGEKKRKCKKKNANQLFFIFDPYHFFSVQKRLTSLKLS